MFKNIKIGLRLTIGFALVILFMIIIILFAFQQFRADHNNLDRVVKEVNVRVRIANKMIDNSRDIVLSMNQILLYHLDNDAASDIEGLENNLEKNWKLYDENAAKLKPLVLLECRVGKELYKEILRDEDSARLLLTRVVELVDSGKIHEAGRFMLTDASGAAERWIKSNQTFISHSEEHVEIFYEEAHAGQESASSSMLILGFLATVITIIFVYLLTSGITNPLMLSIDAANRIAQGDFSENNRFDVHRRDELGLLNKAFSRMTVKLRGSIKEIVESVNMLGSSSSEILAATTQVATSSVETATAISQTTTTVEEVRQASQQSAQKAGKVAENSNEVVMVTQSGNKAVEDTMKVMDGISRQMEIIASAIVSLSEQSQQIGGIIASVNDVTDQSNLLAVNASIEAANAGEHGKGFAVVAREIKNLAHISKESTNQISNILNDIQKATASAVLAAEQGSKAVETGVKQSSKAGETIRLLAKSVNESVQSATQIVASSHQQVVGMDQVGVAMNNINQAGAENAASMKQAEKAAKDLNELGQKLKALVDQYSI